jgi:hypothetical protein
MYDSLIANSVITFFNRCHYVWINEEIIHDIQVAIKT